MRITDWSSDVCSSDLSSQRVRSYRRKWKRHTRCYRQPLLEPQHRQYWQNQLRAREDHLPSQERYSPRVCGYCTEPTMKREGRRVRKQGEIIGRTLTTLRSDEQTSELQSLMRISYAD